PSPGGRRAGPVPLLAGARHTAVGLVGGPHAGRGRVTERFPPPLAALPLLLWRTPPGLELVLAQEGVPFQAVRDAHPYSFRGGRFVLFDSRTTPRSALAGLLTPDHVALDVDALREGEPSDPFAALVDVRAVRAAWSVGPWRLFERVGRYPKAWI